MDYLTCEYHLKEYDPTLLLCESAFKKNELVHLLVCRTQCTAQVQY